MTLRPLRALVALLAATCIVAASAAPAWAHGGPVDVNLVGRSVDGSTVSYTVALTYQNDGHPVIGSGVGVDASGPGGSRHAALRAVGATGRYAGSIELGPGSWTVHFVNEEGDLTITQQVGPVATTVPPTTRPPTTEPPRTTVPRTVPRSPATTSPTTVVQRGSANATAAGPATTTPRTTGRRTAGADVATAAAAPTTVAPDGATSSTTVADGPTTSTTTEVPAHGAGAAPSGATARTAPRAAEQTATDRVETAASTTGGADAGRPTGRSGTNGLVLAALAVLAATATGGGVLLRRRRSTPRA